MRYLVMLFGALVLLGCDRSIEEAQRVVADRMKDPRSVQFRNVATGSLGHVCGELNAKNSYGAYVGFKRFFVDSIGNATIESDTLPFTDFEWTLACDAVRVPTWEVRYALLDSARRADSLSDLSARRLESQRVGYRFELETMRSQLEILQLRTSDPYTRRSAELHVRLMQQALDANVYPVIGLPSKKLMYGVLCREMLGDIREWEVLQSREEGVRAGYREVESNECTRP
jgi:hypothetical protein